jgi:hypothetical protein
MSTVSFTNNIISRAIECDRKILHHYLNNELHNQNNYTYYFLINAINRESPHKILDIDDEEYPLKIFSLNSDWYTDTTPVIMYQLFSTNANIFKKFIEEYNTMVVKQIDENKSGPLEYISDYYNIRVKINIVSRSIN